MIDSFWVGYIVVGVVTVLPSSNLVLDEIRLERDFSVQCDRRASEHELSRHFDEIPRKTIFVDRSVETKLALTLIILEENGALQSGFSDAKHAVKSENEI